MRRKVAGTSRTPTVLFIDDDEGFAAAVGEVLQKAGYRVVRACDGDQGVRMAKQETPDVILLDLMMPVKSGFEACAELRQIAALRHVPVVALTAFGQNIGEVHRLSQSCRYIQDFLEKPVEINVLLSRLQDALAKAGQ